MSRRLSDLEPGFRAAVDQLLAACQAAGHELRPFFTLRDPWDQARLWRQSRPRPEIERAVGQLRARRASWLAGVLEAVGPQNGRWATNALPGQSWHNHGLALDCFVSENGSAIWEADHPGYQTYAVQARALGLTAGHFWARRDSVHVQARAGGVLDEYNWPELDRLMRDRFAGLQP